VLYTIGATGGAVAVVAAGISVLGVLPIEVVDVR
jgi:hypothetical protein